MFVTTKSTTGQQKRSSQALRNTSIRSPWVRTAPRPQRIGQPGWPRPTRPPNPPPPGRQQPSPMSIVQLTPCCILFPPQEASQHSWVYPLLQRDVLSGINVATLCDKSWAFTHWFICLSSTIDNSINKSVFEKSHHGFLQQSSVRWYRPPQLPSPQTRLPERFIFSDFDH